jgi:hypothetical protein
VIATVAAVDTPVNLVAAPIESIFDAITPVVQMLGSIGMAVRREPIGAFVQVLIDTRAVLVEVLIDAVAAVFGQHGCRGQQGEQASGENSSGFHSSFLMSGLGNPGPTLPTTYARPVG